jgi:hypothetical protein
MIREASMTTRGGKTLEVIKTNSAGPPAGPYSQGSKAGGLVVAAGEKWIDPLIGKIVVGGIRA